MQMMVNVYFMEFHKIHLLWKPILLDRELYQNEDLLTKDKFGLIFKRSVLWKHASKVCSSNLSTINRKEKESKAPVWKHRRQS